MSKKKTCFVVTAIGEAGTDTRYNADNVLKHLINPICKELDIEVTRVDQESATGDINQSILNHLLKDDLVIADMTGHNPNAFYELGYRQALGLPLVPIISKTERLPFDVSGYRTVFYSLHIAEIEKSKEELKAMIQSFSHFQMDVDKKQPSEFQILNQKLDKILTKLETRNKKTTPKPDKENDKQISINSPLLSNRYKEQTLSPHLLSRDLLISGGHSDLSSHLVSLANKKEVDVLAGGLQKVNHDSL